MDNFRGKVRGRGRDERKREKRDGFTRKKVCKLCREDIGKVDYKDLKLLERFVTERGKIISSRMSGNCAKHQRTMGEAIKRARFIALLPYTR